MTNTMNKTVEPERVVTDDDVNALCEIFLKNIREIECIVKMFQSDGENLTRKEMVSSIIREQFDEKFLGLLSLVTEMPIVALTKMNPIKYLEDKAKTSERVWNQVDEIKKACPQ